MKVAPRPQLGPPQRGVGWQPGAENRVRGGHHWVRLQSLRPGPGPILFCDVLLLQLACSYGKRRVVILFVLRDFIEDGILNNYPDASDSDIEADGVGEPVSHLVGVCSHGAPHGVRYFVDCTQKKRPIYTSPP